MNRTLGFLILGLVATSSAHALASCSYELQLDDSFGDGWNGAQLFVTVDGVPEGTYAASGFSTTVTFTAESDQVVILTYTEGSFEGENSYPLTSTSGVGARLLFSDGPFL